MSDLTIVSSAEERQLALSLGAAPDADNQGGGVRIPLLKINLDDEDENGKELPKGHFYLTNQDTSVYANSVKIRPLAELICPLLGGPKSMLFWTRKGKTNAIQETHAGRDYRQAA